MIGGSRSPFRFDIFGPMSDKCLNMNLFNIIGPITRIIEQKFRFDT